MRKQWSQPHGQVPGNPGKAEEPSFRKCRSNIRIRLKDTRMRKSCRCRDHSRSSGSGVPWSSGRPPPITWPIYSLQFASLGFSDFLSLSTGFPTFYPPSFHTDWVPIDCAFSQLQLAQGSSQSPLYLKALSFAYPIQFSLQIAPFSLCLNSNTWELGCQSQFILVWKGFSCQNIS